MAAAGDEEGVVAEQRRGDRDHEGGDGVQDEAGDAAEPEPRRAEGAQDGHGREGADYFEGFFHGVS